MSVTVVIVLTATLILAIVGGVIVASIVVLKRHRAPQAHNERGLASHGMATEQAIAALLSMQAASLKAMRVSETEVRVHLLSIGDEDVPRPGALIPRQNFTLELDTTVRFNEAKRKYSFITRHVQTGRSDAQTGEQRGGWAMRSETFRGVYRLRLRHKKMSLSGVELIDFDSRVAFDMIEGVLRPLGWTRGW